MSGFMDWVQGQKDTSASFVAQKVLRQKLEPFGELLDFQLQSRQQSARLKVLLKGESEPISVLVDQYQVTQERGETAVVVAKATASREWITRLLQEFVVGKRFPIPQQYASYAKMLL
jgi:hypothetical protein